MPRGRSFSAASYRDVAVVLRTYPLGEADRIVVLLTQEHGQLRAVAKGIRRTTSRFGARLEPFNLSDVQLVHGRNLEVISQAVGRKSWADPIAHDYAKFTAAAAVVEAAEKMTEDSGPCPEHYALVAGALSAIARGLHDPAAIVDSYLIRAVSVSGWAPSLCDCARCGNPGPHRCFSSELGGIVCQQCRPPGALSPEAETVQYLEALVYGHWEIIDAALPRVAIAASHIVAAYAQFHMEKTIRALAMVERN